MGRSHLEYQQVADALHDPNHPASSEESDTSSKKSESESAPSRHDETLHPKEEEEMDTGAKDLPEDGPQEVSEVGPVTPDEDALLNGPVGAGATVTTPQLNDEMAQLQVSMEAEAETPPPPVGQ